MFTSMTHGEAVMRIADGRAPHTGISRFNNVVPVKSAYATRAAAMLDTYVERQSRLNALQQKPLPAHGLSSRPISTSITANSAGKLSCTVRQTYSSATVS